MIRAMLSALALTGAAPCAAQVAYPPTVTPDQLAAVAATIPVPASSVPPAEVVGGAVGSAGTYRPASAVNPRITRATNCTLDANGSCTVTWATALSTAPIIVTTPVNPTAAQPIACNTTATPTISGVSIKCWILQTTALSLAIVTSGINLAPATLAPAGTVVQITALPPTQ